MRHLLFITGEYPPMEGGVGAYTAELGEALVAQGVQVSVITSLRAMSKEKEQKQSTSTISVYPILEKWGVSIWSAIDQLASKIGADLLHIQYQTAAYGMNPAINFAPMRWRRRLPVAWTYHDLLPPYLFPKVGAFVRRWVTEFPAKTSNFVIVTNEGDRQQLANKGVRATKIPIGSNISGTLHTSDQRQLRRRQRNFAHTDLVIGYFGFLNRSKGGATVVRTLHRLAQQRRNVRLLMIGDVTGASDPTNQAYFAEIEQMIIDLGLIDRVQWTGREADEQVSADLGACDLLLLPYEDGASLRRGSLMAALANGCPIITTFPQAPMPELEEGRDLLYIAAGDDTAAAAAVLRIAQDRQLAMNLRYNAWERSKLFGWEAIAKEHLLLFNHR
ncbi:MAG: glycosyltransferase family 4 protein [Caldilineaceae bacterium]